MRLSLWLALLVGSALVIESSIMPRVTAATGLTADLVLVVTLAYSLTRGSAVGSSVGFFGGALQDLLVGGMVGLGALAKVAVAHIGGLLERNLITESRVLTVLAVLALSALHQAIYAGMLALLGLQLPALSKVALSMILMPALTSTGLFLVVYPLVARVAGGRPVERVALQ